MEYKVGDKVRIIKPQNKNWGTEMDHLIGKVMTIKEIDYNKYGNFYEYSIEEDSKEFPSLRWPWGEEDFELVSYKEEIKMKATGMIRRIDELGRVAIPKEIQRALDIREGDPIEIFMDGEGEVKLKKYRPKKSWYIDSITEEVKYSEGWKPSSIGNAFETKEEAEWMLEHLKLIHEMKEWVKDNDDDFKPDWEDDEQDKNFLYRLKGKIYYDFFNVHSVGLVICFSSPEKARKAIEHFGEERILKYYFPN